ncbi:adenosylcobinamide-GDP ribazoletransferase [Halovulum sp. GXIMD14794]
MSAELQHALNALRFLTRVPVPVIGTSVTWNLGRTARWFPLAGLVVGSASAAVWWLAMALGVPPLAAAGLAIATQALITGGLHEDGLADLADGLGSGAPRERALEIMRDSRIGAHGALALGLSLLLRVAALSALDPLAGATALILANVLSRAFVALSLATLPYARSDGLAAGGQTGGRGMMLSLILTLALVLVLGRLGGVLALVVALLAWGWICWRLMRRLGGHTGDGLGATEQIVQIAALVTLSAAWS